VNVGEMHRRDYGRILASLIRVVHDIELAEDSLQEAFAAAVVQWEREGPPRNPASWLLSTARHKAIDEIRRRARAENRTDELAAMPAPEDDDEPVPLDSLRLIFTCCHPSLSPEAQMALALRTICGLETEEIARAFLVPTATMAQRLVRAKGKIKMANIPYAVPPDDALPERLDAAMEIVYLLFNEGYSASFGESMVRADLCAEAIRLGTMLVQLLPAEHEAKGLLALMLLHDARRATRVDDEGIIVLLEDQDRSRWDRAKIEEGAALVPAAMRGRPLGPYAVQAAIAALHVEAPAAKDTDWRQIAALYGVLYAIHPSPVIALNRAVAVAMADGPLRGLELLREIHLPDYHLLPAARADLLRRLGRTEDAKSEYRAALGLVKNDSERRFLERRLATLDAV
jgi:RNA polymerase sigma-70 factor (ECF subfamily)